MSSHKSAGRKLVVDAEAARSAVQTLVDVVAMVDPAAGDEPRVKACIHALTPVAEGGEAVEIPDYLTQQLATDPAFLRAFLDEHERHARERALRDAYEWTVDYRIKANLEKEFPEDEK